SPGAHAGRRRIGVAMRRTTRSVAALVSSLMICGPFLAGCGTYAALDKASPDATRITNLHWLVFWVTGGVSFLLIAALAIALTRRRTAQTGGGERPGLYEGRCAEFCGYQHAHMGFLLIAEAPDRFEAWMASQRRPAAEPSDVAGHHGREVFLSSGCVLCHTIRSIGAFGHKAPDLTHLASRRMIGSAALPNTTGHLAGWVVDSQRIKPGNHMPPNLMPAEHLLDLVSYLRSPQ